MSEAIPRQKRRSRDQWQRLVDEQAHSGLTQTAFCQAQGLSLASFGNWKRRLGAESAGEPSWFELGSLDAANSSPGWDIELQLGQDICLRLRRC